MPGFSTFTATRATARESLHANAQPSYLNVSIMSPARCLPTASGESSPRSRQESGHSAPQEWCGSESPVVRTSVICATLIRKQPGVPRHRPEAVLGVTGWCRARNENVHGDDGWGRQFSARRRARGHRYVKAAVSSPRHDVERVGVSSGTPPGQPRCSEVALAGV